MGRGLRLIILYLQLNFTNYRFHVYTNKRLISLELIKQRNYDISISHFLIVAVRSLGKKRSKVVKVQEEELVDVPVETDPELLARYVCGTKLTTEEENIAIKPDSEYPDWLWSLRRGKKKTCAQIFVSKH